jgi:phosphoserine phosphatase RsbU/P
VTARRGVAGRAIPDAGVDVERVSLFRGADATLVREAIADCEIRELAAGTVLLRAGESNDTIYVLLSGQMAAYLADFNVADAAIPIEPGQCVGEMSAVDGQPVSALVLVVTQARVLVLPGAIFWSRLSAVASIGRNLVAMLSMRMRQSNKTVLEAQRRRLALEHLRSELQTARELQANMIPGRGRLFPDRTDIEIAGLMDPADEIGGDFFDAFFIDSKTLFICIGDVSGHGIPAALFMARVVGLVRVAAIASDAPNVVLARLNDQLCRGNDAGVFVTLFCAFLNIDSGLLAYANGGHCAPLLVDGESVAPLAIPKGPLIGVYPNLHYAMHTTVLDAGATLLCFTDGVVEGESPDSVAFGDVRLASTALRHGAGPVTHMVDAVQQALAFFTAGDSRSDDCTLLALRRPYRADSPS